MGSPLKKAKSVSGGYKCHYCYHTFKAQSSVYRHQKTDCNAAHILSGKTPITKGKKKDPMRFTCEICTHAFDRQGKLDIHRKTQHTNTPRYECGKFGRSFSRADHYGKHENKCNYHTSSSFPSFINSFNETDESIQNNVCCE